MSDLVHLQVRNSKADETPIEAASQIFASLLPSYLPPLKRLYIKPKTYAFEIYLIGQTIYFYATCTPKTETFVKSLITSSFTNSKIIKTKDPLDMVLDSPARAIGEVALSSYYYLPIKTYFDFKDIDPLSSVLGFLARSLPTQKAAIQILITPASFSWATGAAAQGQKMAYDKAADKYGMNPQKMIISRKTSFQGGKALVRILTGDSTPDGALAYLHNVAGTFGSFSLGEGNQFSFKKPRILKQKLLERMINRKTFIFERQNQILNAQELASMWHPPGILLAGIKNIAWGKTLSGEPPDNLPIPEESDEEARKDINFFAKTEFKNKDQIFGIKTADRRKHVYIIGKTGAGKTTLIANMAIDDIRRGRGIGIIDPHGDLSEIILDFIPKRRINDVVYLEPFDSERPFKLNVLEVHNPEQKHLVASGIVSIFSKLYGKSWGPRLEYILRNVILTLLEIPGATLVDALRILSDDEYRARVVREINDPVLKNFWNAEFAKMGDKLRAEAVSPIQNKVGQFVTSTMIRNIIGTAKSSINLAEIMDEGKILILNLSQGKLGEDNASLLGAMIITQIQLAAMGRSFSKEEDRRDFFLYVDEFQNFATNSFIKILSEARKYRLSLTLANQYTEQLELEIQRAIFGNVGTLMSFVLGARDAYFLSKEFGEIYTENDLVSLGRYETVMKLSVDNMTSNPFPAHTLPLPALKNDNREKIIATSKEKYGRKNVKELER